jgi:hypothetical protein
MKTNWIMKMLNMWKISCSYSIKWKLGKFQSVVFIFTACFSIYICLSIKHFEGYIKLAFTQHTPEQLKISWRKSVTFFPKVMSIYFWQIIGNQLKPTGCCITVNYFDNCFCLSYLSAWELFVTQALNKKFKLICLYTYILFLSASVHL